MKEQPSCLSCGPLSEFSGTSDAIDNDLETAKWETCWIVAAVLPPSLKDAHSFSAGYLLGFQLLISVFLLFLQIFSH